MCLSTCIVLIFLLINTLLASLLFVIMEILFCKAEAPKTLAPTAGLVARIWCLHCPNTTSISGWEPSPTPSYCRSRPPEIISRRREREQLFKVKIASHFPKLMTGNCTHRHMKLRTASRINTTPPTHKTYHIHKCRKPKNSVTFHWI